MQGKRVYDTDLFKVGEYGLIGDTWYACTPSGDLASLAGHQVTEHADGTITVSPSILVSRGDGHGGWQEAWHGYLEHGVWRAV